MFTHKIVYKKDNWLISLESGYNPQKKRGMIQANIVDELFDISYIGKPIVIYEPRWFARFFLRDTLDKRVRRAIEECKKKIDLIIIKEAKNQGIEKLEVGRIDAYLERVPELKSNGLKKAKWQVTGL